MVGGNLCKLFQHFTILHRDTLSNAFVILNRKFLKFLSEPGFIFSTMRDAPERRRWIARASGSHRGSQTVECS